MTLLSNAASDLGLNNLGRTPFFSDMRTFVTLERAVLPILLEKAASTQTFTAWCLGDNIAQTAQSLAMLLDDRFTQTRDWTVRILRSPGGDQATDPGIKGAYSQASVNDGLPARYLIRYFVKEGTSWQISSVLKQRIQYLDFDIDETWPYFPSVDLVVANDIFERRPRDAALNLASKMRWRLKSTGAMLVRSDTHPEEIESTFVREGPDGRHWYRVKSLAGA